MPKVKLTPDVATLDNLRSISGNNNAIYNFVLIRNLDNCFADKRIFLKFEKSLRINI